MRVPLGLVITALLLGCSPEPVTEQLGTAVKCRPLGRVCTVSEAGRAVSLRLPAEIKPLTRFPVKVALEGIDADAVVVEFTMKGMDMGLNRFGLQSGDGGWSGEAILPVCTTGRTDWLATVEAQTAGGVVRADFTFLTTR